MTTNEECGDYEEELLTVYRRLEEEISEKNKLKERLQSYKKVAEVRLERVSEAISETLDEILPFKRKRGA